MTIESSLPTTWLMLPNRPVRCDRSGSAERSIEGRDKANEGKFIQGLP
jgi:hypothetical protein